MVRGYGQEAKGNCKGEDKTLHSPGNSTDPCLL
jgi:hypothetical protein